MTSPYFRGEGVENGEKCRKHRSEKKCDLEKGRVKNQEKLGTSFMDDPITSLHYVEPRNHAKNNKNLEKKTYDCDQKLGTPFEN